MRQVLYFFVILQLICSSCSHDGYRTTSGAAWGTLYHITYKSPKDLSDSVVAEMRRVELSLSMFEPSSSVSRINAGETDTLDEALSAVMALSMRVNRASHGFFDPTVAPLVDLWGFGRKGRDTALPDSSEVASALARVGLARCRIEDGRIVRGAPGMQFDFSAIAKGYGVDRVAAMLRRNGCTDYMVEIGGEVSVSGLNPGSGKWRIRVDSPTCDEASLGVLDITDCAVATSGNYRNYRDIAPDSVAGHTIDPTTGYPAPTRVLSVTVIAPVCALADALATSVMAMPDTAVSHRMIRLFPSVSALVAMPDTVVGW